jgi:hypothetical protein
MSIVKLNNRGVRSATTFGSITGLGSMVFIKKQTASSSATISFVDGTSDVVLDDTYKEYLFTFNNIHPATDQTNFVFQGNAAGGSGYNETMTTTTFQAQHSEGGSSELSYESGMDLAQATDFQRIAHEIGNDNDQSTSGFLRIFNPSSTTFVKHFIAESQSYRYNDYSHRLFTAGYFNTTSAIDEIQFKMSSGNMDAGDICLYGIN